MSRPGCQKILAGGAPRFDFLSTLAFLPPNFLDPVHPVTELVVVSNHQERSPLTNDAVTKAAFNLPFLVAKIRLVP